jgi:phospholipid/cholesterol/gamma-HCH transport system substrate-binding protein
MSTPTNHWKLGLFLVTGAVLGMGTVVVLGANSLHKETVGYKTYFDESVQGLDIGSPVKFRGVKIGAVSSIDIASDQRHVEVTSDLNTKDLKELGLFDTKGKPTRLNVPDDLRMQLASQGITGVKFMQLDFFDIKDNPPPVLPFVTPKDYIPAAVSTMKNLEDAIVHAVNRVPEVAEELLRVMRNIRALLESVESAKLPEQATATLGQVNALVATLTATVNRVNAPKLSEHAHGTLDSLNATIGRLDGLVAHMDSEKGLVASVQRATNAMGDVAVNARAVPKELIATLRDVQQLTLALQRVADALERDPDMLLKGRGKVK